MNRRDYLDLTSAGIGAAITGSLDALSTENTASTHTPTRMPSLDEFLVRQDLLREGYESKDKQIGFNPGTYFLRWQRDDRPPLYHAERTFGLVGGEESAPAELTSRVLKLGEEGSETTATLREELLEWMFHQRYNRRDPAEYDFTGWVESSSDETEINGHQRKWVWARLPILYRRSDVPQPNDPPTKPYWEYATVVQATPWGAFEVTAHVEYPADRGQTLQTVRQLADWKTRLVASLDSPVPENVR